MKYMFFGAGSFNQNINGWNTAKVSTTNAMFSNAMSFNQDINGWNTARVTDMYYMFEYASNFNQDINSWNTTMVDYWDDIFTDTQCPHTSLSLTDNNMCQSCGRRDRYLSFLPESSNNKRNHEEERHHNLAPGEDENRHRKLQDDDITPSSFDIKVGVIKETDGPAALQTDGGASPSLGLVMGIILGLVSAVFLA